MGCDTCVLPNLKRFATLNVFSEVGWGRHEQGKTKSTKTECRTICDVQYESRHLSISEHIVAISFCLVLGLSKSKHFNLVKSSFFSVIATGFVVRIFIIFHDCTHASFFKNRTWNRIVGNVCGVLTHFPFEKWKHSHAIHHATSGNLDKRGVGDIWVMTIDEYKEATKFERLKYRLYRNPLILFGLGPLYLFLVDNRINKKGAKRKEKYNTYLTNVCIVSYMVS